MIDRSETPVKNVNEELPYESTGVHKNKPSLSDVFEKDDNTGNNNYSYHTMYLHLNIHTLLTNI